MSADINYLERLDEGKVKDASVNADHPMRKVTHQVAFEPSGWTSERASKVVKLFDEMAESWRDKDFGSRSMPVVDALNRGGIEPGGLGIELGCGTGAYSTMLSKHFDSLLCVDISFEMLARSTSDDGYRVRGDGSRLPVADGSVEGLFCINTLLFPGEVDRVLGENGYLVWVSTSGNQTPIYLSPEDVYSALGGRFQGVSSEAGPGTWTVFRRG